MKKIYKAAVIGGGAAGLMCAVELFSQTPPVKLPKPESAPSVVESRVKNPENFKNRPEHGEVIIIEKNDRVGKKLLATGNGQCNLSNARLSENNYYGERDFVKSAVSVIKQTNIPSYFYRLGLPLTEGDEGKLYPLSRRANAVCDLFRAYLTDKAEFLLGTTVSEINFKDGVFIIGCKNSAVYAENVVVAAGGAAGKQYGTDGTSYRLLEGFGHKRTKIYPSLVQVKTERDKIKGLKGVKECADVSAYDGDRLLKRGKGEVLFTEYGISGTAVFQVSGHLASAVSPWVKISFLPEIDFGKLKVLLSDRIKFAPYMTGENLLNGIVNKKTGVAVMKTAESLSPEDLSFALKNFSLRVNGTLGFDSAQVTKGGIDTHSFDPVTFESKLQRGLYAVGEILNVDGDCGGYNLSFAFASAIAAARNIKERM